jgi:hypothetical protein
MDGKIASVLTNREIAGTLTNAATANRQEHVPRFGRVGEKHGRS